MKSKTLVSRLRKRIGDATPEFIYHTYSEDEEYLTIPIGVRSYIFEVAFISEDRCNDDKYPTYIEFFYACDDVPVLISFDFIRGEMDIST